jgi:hypothetical protein
MKKSTQVFTRVMDVAMLASLVLGGADVRTFAFWMISIMVAFLFLGCLGMTQDLAEKIQGRSLYKKAFGILVHTFYVAALVYAGFPILAAIYATAASFIRVAAESKLTPRVAS